MKICQYSMNDKSINRIVNSEHKLFGLNIC